LYLLLFPFFFAAAWIVACWSVAAFSGWWQLARRYRCSAQIIGTTWRSQSAMLDRRFVGSYNNCLTLIAHDDGLGLSVSFFLVIGHPPLFIPWSEILFSERRCLFFFRRVCLTFQHEPSISLCITSRLAGKIQSAVGQNWFENIGQPAHRESP
jgi:hypothetical protein